VGGPLFNRLRIAERYKTEVFERLRSLDQELSVDDMRALREAFGLIRDEARTFNVFDEETLRSSFSDDEVCEELLEIGRDWGDTAATLVACVEANDSARLRACLSALDALNDRYRAIVAARYADLLNR
jgi:hypothetical protein